MALKLIGQALAQQIDAELMNPAVGGFSIDQLMELAGLSVAQAIYKQYDRKAFPRVLVVAGPGNNGGDGLVAARHLVHFGYKPTIHYPKPTKKDLYKNLQTQLHNLKVPFTDSLNDALTRTDLIIDAIFGFSFSGDIRPPFDSVIKTLKQTSIPIASIDIPSGWDVEKGNVSDLGLNAETLISLTAPKEGTRNFKGHHWLGGRFVPPETGEKLGLHLPEFPDTDQCVKIA